MTTLSASDPDISALINSLSSSDNEEDRKKNYKPCVTCYKPYSVSKFSSFRNCQDCRRKNRKKREEAHQRKQARMQARRELEVRWEQVKEGVEPAEKVPPVGGGGVEEGRLRAVEEQRRRERRKLKKKRKLERALKAERDRNVASVEDDNSNNKDENERVTSTGAAKRKSPKALHELETEEKRVVLGMIKNDLKQRVQVKGNKRVVVSGVVTVSPAGVPEVVDSDNEYQSASALYESLKKRLKKSSNSSTTSQLLRFKGFHSIVAVSTIDHQKRVDLVAQDLRKIVRVSFEHTKPYASYDFQSQARSVSFKCTCLGYEPAPTPPVSAIPNSAIPNTAQPTSAPSFAVKGTPGDLIHQGRARAALATLEALNGGSAAGAGATSATGGGGGSGGVGIARFCGGTVKITALDDTRHPLAILGQRIVVVIEHGLGHGNAK